MKLDRPQLKDSPFLPASRDDLRPARRTCFDAIRKGDILLHHPYDSFDPVLHFLERPRRTTRTCSRSR